MSTLFPDISGYQAGIDLRGVPFVTIKATEGTYYTNPDYRRARDNAWSHGTWVTAYHFLRAGNGAGQADYAYRQCGANANGPGFMLDVELSASSSAPNMSDALAFVGEYRRLGGRLNLLYLPLWFWRDYWGRPSLAPLEDEGLSLWSSDYTGTYSDGGPGFAPYGGMTPAIWQYTDHHNVNGYECDYNGTPLTLAELERLAIG